MAALLACGLPGEAAAQDALGSAGPFASAAGRVGRRNGGDTVPVAGARVLLHAVTAAEQGPVDSVATDARGRFRFRFRADTGALYLVSARHHGIEYFSAPFAAAAARAGAAADLGIVVADTSSRAVVSMASRHIVIMRPGDRGVRDIFDLATLRNTGTRTRIAPDTVRPSWVTPAPAGTEGLEVGQGDFSPEAVTRRGDSVLVFAPIAPGEKQLAAEYHLPAARRAVDIAFAEPVATVNLLVEESGARVSGFAGAAVDTQMVEGRTFRRWYGSVAAGDTVRVVFGGGGRSERWVLIALVGVMAAALAAAAWRYRVLAVLLVALLPACRRASERTAAITVVDDAGDTTTLAAPARRVVSLIPATTELLFAIGAGDLVVGRTKWCDYPAAASAVADVGDGVNPNVETVLARRPDLVILYRSVQHTALVDRFRSLGIPAIQLNTDALADVGRIARLLGRLSGHGRGADSVAAVFDAALANASRPAAGRRPSVLLLVWEQPPMTVGTGSYLSEIVERAGGTNLFADVPATSAAVSIEAVAARAPDLVLLTTEGPAAFAARPEWRVVEAVRRRRFIRVSGSAFGYPGPRSPAAIAELARRLREATRP